MHATRLTVTMLALVCITPLALAGEAEDGFVPIFNGEDLTGWTGSQYLVEDGMLVCPAQGGGTILTEKEYANFIYRFEFKLPPGGNNGVEFRRPAAGGPGLEIQILDDYHPRYANLAPYQYHGSVYGLVPAKRGATKPAGEWNTEEIYANGSRVRVRVNDQTIVDTDLSQITDPEVLKARPGIRNMRGRLGFRGHGARIEFRNLRIRELRPDNVPPAGFEAAFNGVDLTGWKGLVADPPKRAAMSAEELTKAQEAADQRMRDNWKVEHGALVFSGKGDSLCTVKDYGDFCMLVDWKILPAGDSGIYLRGSPQVQIWERPDIGSGGLYNNQNNPSQPDKIMDRRVGRWNRFRIIMRGENVTVYFNGELVVDNVTMENYWERDKPIYPTGQLELQNHGNTLWFKNVFIKELTRTE